MIDGFSPWPAAVAARYRERGYWRGITLGSLLRGAAEQHGARTALVDGQRRWTYCELDEWADRIACGLDALGIGSGERVLVHLPNVAEFVPLCFGLFRRGVIPVLALAAHQESEIAHLAELSGAVAYVILDRHLGRDYRDTARAVQDRLPGLRHVLVIGAAAEFIPFGSLDITDRTAVATGPEPAAGDVALMLLSGGSTGLPKLIPRTHDDYVYNATASAEVCGLGPDTGYLVALPIAHNFPLACPGILGTLAVGGTVVVCPTPSPDDAFALIARERITITALVPALVMVWIEMAEACGAAGLESLELLQVGGSRLKTQTAQRVTPVLGCLLQQVYGMAEGLLNYTRADDDAALVTGTQGRPLCPDDEVQVVDEDDREVEPGAVGELLTRGPYTLRGYFGSAAANRRSFTADGFYRTGDLVRRLPSGHFVVEGRINDVINRGGEKIGVEEVEEHILSHPAVHDVALLAVPDGVLGERSCAVVIARGTAPTRPELNAHLRARGLAAFKFPDRLVVLEVFPRTAVGKADKRALATMVEVGA